MIDEWLVKFPEKCIICHYWEHGRAENFTKEKTPKHSCTTINEVRSIHKRKNKKRVSKK